MSVEVVLMCGVPGSGKSTWRRHHLDESHVVVSKDLMPRSVRKQLRQEREIRAAIGLGRPVVVDNTHITRAERAPVIALARALGAPCRAVVVRAPLEASLERNAARSGREQVPHGIVRQMARQWEEPSLDEGLVSVMVVQT